MQLQNGVCRNIAHASMTFSQAQSRYSTIERELTAIRIWVQTFRSFIYGVHFSLYTDHKPLIYLNNMSIYSSRMRRTLNELSEYDFEIKYRPGPLNQAADILSRMDSSNHSLITMDEDYNKLPKEFQVISKVDGGGDSLFQSFVISFKYERDDEDDRDHFPNSHSEHRSVSVSEIVNNP